MDRSRTHRGPLCDPPPVLKTEEPTGTQPPPYLDYTLLKQGVTVWLSGSGGTGKTHPLLSRHFWQSALFASGKAAVRLEPLLGRRILRVIFDLLHTNLLFAYIHRKSQIGQISTQFYIESAQRLSLFDTLAKVKAYVHRQLKPI